MKKIRVRTIALYLPQFHPIPENDKWWGKGFTEWTNTAKAKPLFRGHYQPHVPADLGFYDLRVNETRIAQAEMAREYGIEAFCYYHYWFGGKQLLEKPFQEVLASGRPDFPFCLCWANQTWSGIWHGNPDKVLIEQTYPGRSDYQAHFDTVLPAFRDSRYFKVEGKPLFVVYAPENLPDSKEFTSLWQNLAVNAGLPGIYFVAERRNQYWRPSEFGFDAAYSNLIPPRRNQWYPWSQPIRKLRNKFLDISQMPTIYSYDKIVAMLTTTHVDEETIFPMVVPNWDNTPRSGSRGLVLHGSDPELFQRNVRDAVSAVERYKPEQKIIFIKSWNEWAEGNHLEPDLRFGRRYLEVLFKELSEE